MKKKRILLLLFLFVLAFDVLATRNRENECVKPRFSKFVPGQHAEVPPGAEFSFVASGNTLPGTITVTVKKIEAEFTIEDRDIFYKVIGKLPDSLEGTFARISVSAKADSGRSKTACRRAKGGWLIKITEKVKEEPKEAEALDDTEGEEATEMAPPDS